MTHNTLADPVDIGPPPSIATSRPYARRIVESHEIPSYLLGLNVWVGWKIKWQPGEKKPGKVPVSPLTGRSDGWGNNPAFAASFERAYHFAHQKQLHGLGALLWPGCGFAGIDIDHCRDPHTGELSDLAREILTAADTYFEISPGQSGVRGFFRGSFGGFVGNDDAHGIEFYESGRFLTVTGDHLDQTPFAIETRDLTALGRRFFPAKGKTPPPTTGAVADFVPLDLSGLGLAPHALKTIRSGDAARYGNDRSKMLFATAKDLVKAGLNDEDIARVLCDPANGVSAKPLEERGGDLTSAMKWVLKYTIPAARGAVENEPPPDPAQQGKQARPELPPEPSSEEWPAPRQIPMRGDMGEAEPIPVDQLPPSLCNAAREVARFSKVDEASPALVGISVLATAIGKRAVVVEREGLSHHPALFMAGISESGTRKTPPFRYMTAPLEDWADAQEEVWKVEERRARSRNAAVEAQIKRVKANKDKKLKEMEQEIEELEAERLTVPPKPKLFTTDTTEERAFQLMHEREGAFAVMSGEGRPVIDAILGKYSGGNRTGDAIYLAGISGDTISRDRVGSADAGGPESLTMRRPCLNVCIMVQPDKYMEAATHPALRASGALARIWPAWLPSMLGKQHEEPGELGLSTSLMEPYHKLVRDILDHVPRTDDQGRPVPHVARLSRQATEARRVFHNAIQDMMPEGGDLADCRDIAAKAVTQTCKLALVLHLAQHPEVLSNRHSEIDIKTWVAAQAVGTWFLTEAVRVQRSAVDDPLMEAARRILSWLDREHERGMPRELLTVAILSREGPRPRPKRAEAEDILELLEDYDWIRRARKVEARKPVYALHPLFRQFRQNSRGVR